MKRGRKIGSKNSNNPYKVDGCSFCEGTTRHFGKDCAACNGTGSDLVRKQLQKVYNATNKLPLNYNLIIDKTEA